MTIKRLGYQTYQTPLGTGSVFLIGAVVGFIGGFFVYTALGRRVVMVGAGRVGRRIEERL